MQAAGCNPYVESFRAKLDYVVVEQEPRSMALLAEGDQRMPR